VIERKKKKKGRYVEAYGKGTNSLFSALPISKKEEIKKRDSGFLLGLKKSHG